MAGIDPSTLMTDIGAAIAAVIGKDISTVDGFSQSQLTAIAQQSALVAGGIADGSIDSATRDYFQQSLAEMVNSFTEVLLGLAVVELEKITNAIVAVIWTAIDKATGLGLVAP